MSWRAAAFGFLLALSGTAGAELQEGRDYLEIDPVPVDSGQRIEVIEFFFYGCKSCYRIEPVLRDWAIRRESRIDFKLVPALRRSAWIPLSDLFFSLHALGVLPQLHDRVYVAIHEQGRRLSSTSEQIKWAAEHGLDATVFEQAVRSDATMISTQRARDATVAYDIRVTPSIVVDGRYLTTGAMIGNASRVSLVLDQLLELALAARSGALR
ncbi:MAG TPA: thiol:disulfide interchange protein DsbA/DsbL [Burkholderiales bacterium]|nr:thiol:disulfide interchange protein DsbA/DsbL [Burkholderiales bacterium]